MRSRSLPGVLAILSVLTIGCGSDSVTVVDQIPHAEVAGSYNLTALSFDPQGSLPQADVMARIPVANRPTLTLNAQGGAQVTFLHPVSGLTSILDATFETTATNVVVEFEEGQAYGNFLFARTMSFTFSSTAGSLTFDGAAQGVSRDLLVQLIPEWQNEQLNDPTPGTLRVVFTRP